MPDLSDWFINDFAYKIKVKLSLYSSVSWCEPFSKFVKSHSPVVPNHSFCKKTKSSTRMSERCWYIIQYISWKQRNVIGKITRLYLSISLAVIPNILLMSLGVTTDMRGGATFGRAGGGGQVSVPVSSSNLDRVELTLLNLLFWWELLYLVIVFSLLPALQWLPRSCT